MIEILQQSDGKTLGVRLTGKVTDQDYETVFIPALEKLIKEHGKVNCLYFMDDEFVGWDLGAMWDDATFGIKHRNDFDKIAVIGGPKWAQWGTMIAGHLVSAEIKTYPVNEFEQAWAWMKS